MEEHFLWQLKLVNPNSGIEIIPQICYKSHSQSLDQFPHVLLGLH